MNPTFVHTLTAHPSPFSPIGSNHGYHGLDQRNKPSYFPPIQSNPEAPGFGKLRVEGPMQMLDQLSR